MYARVLIVEEDRATAGFLRDAFIKAGFRVFNAFTESDASLQISLARPHVLLLGRLKEPLYYPGFVKRIRDNHGIRTCSVVVLQDGTVPVSTDMALDAGADDVLVLPLAPQEMIARIRMLLRRRAPEFSGLPMSIAHLDLDPVTKQAAFFGKNLKLTPTEFHVLYYLASYPGITISRDQLLDAILIEEQSVDVYVCRIRRSFGVLGESVIQTVRGMGYLFALKASDCHSVANVTRKPRSPKDGIGSILLIEKNTTVRARIEDLLKTAGYQVFSLANANGRKRIFDQHDPSLMIVDTKRSGTSKTGEIHNFRDSPRTKDLPIILIHSAEDRVDRTTLFRAGADDIINPGMNDKEVLARIRATARRCDAVRKPGLIELNGLCLDPTTYLIAHNGQKIKASPKEFKLLHHLLTAPGRAYSRRQLLCHVWGRDCQVTERTVDVHVTRLRAMLGNMNLIQTVRGIGYCGGRVS